MVDHPAHPRPEAAPWEAFHRRWASLRAPLRPPPEVVDRVRQHIGAHAPRVLLLGVTPELSRLGSYTLAVDKSGTALDYIWPGDAANRRAIPGEWQRLPCATGSMSSVVGDGSLNCLAYPDGYREVLAELLRVISPGGCIVIRAFLTPPDCESLDTLRARTLSGQTESVHALKWQIAMALCAERGDANLPVRHISQAFDRLFPDRQALTDATDWPSDIAAHFDAYRGLPDFFSFPTAEQLLATMPPGAGGRLTPVGSYALAERCPLLVVRLT